MIEFNLNRLNWWALKNIQRRQPANHREEKSDFYIQQRAIKDDGYIDRKMDKLVDILFQT